MSHPPQPPGTWPPPDGAAPVPYTPPAEFPAPDPYAPPACDPYAQPGSYGGPPSSDPAGQFPPPDPNQQLADQIPGAVSHGVYSGLPPKRFYPPGLPTPPLRDASPWNLPAFGMLAIFLVAVAALVFPQVRARKVEHQVKPLVAALAQRDAGARCPRYLTSVLTNVGSVSLDGNGSISDHTELTGPICDGLRRLYTPAGRAEMHCLVTDGQCSPSALRSIVALSTVTHESMHLRGVLDEREAECTSISEAPLAGKLAGLTPDESRMIGYLHLVSLNPNTPPQYHVTPANCPGAADLTVNPPSNEAARGLLQTTAEQTWITLASG